MNDYDSDKSIIRDFLSLDKNRHILVIGDLMLDHYVWGDVERISPEAPVPVVQMSRESFRMGGAGNVANNIASLGLDVSIMGIIGKDAHGDRMKELLSKAEINYKGIILDKERPTTTKTRIIAHNQQVVRIDRESSDDIMEDYDNEIFNYLERNIHNYDAVIISDYNKGFITKGNIFKIIDICNKNGILIAIDPKKSDLMVYDNTFIITPNIKEIENYTGRKIGCNNLDVIRDHGIEILERSKIKNLLITLGEAGLMLFTRSHKTDYTYIKTRAKSVFDVTGAGDTVISAFMSAYICGFDVLKSACLANIAAGLVIRKIGTTPILNDDLIAYMG